MALLTMALPIPRLSAPRTRQKPSNDDGLLPEQHIVLGVLGVLRKSPLSFEKRWKSFGVEI
jgi:hypothetical protein